MDYYILIFGIVLLIMMWRTLVIFRRAIGALQQEADVISPILDEFKGKAFRAALLGNFLAAAINGLIAWLVFQSISSLHVITLAPYVFLISQSGIMWGLPALFLGLFLAPVTARPLINKLLGEEQWRLFIANKIRAEGSHSFTVLGHLGYILIPVCFIFTFLSLDNHFTVTEKSVVYNGFDSVGSTEYPFNQITEIKLFTSFEAPNGNIVAKSHYCLSFSDGTVYDFFHTLPANELNFEQQTQLVNFIVKASKAKVITYENYPAKGNKCLAST
ncbi:MAG: hypothetical protein HRT35_34235 [Algicola sp.]|nr:hypothetical protein [Algicola sp.]